MRITMSRPEIGELARVGEALATWQTDDGPVQLHPGDLGWYSQHGPEATAAAIRVWSRGEEPVAIGLLDGAETLRLGISPDLREDEQLAGQIRADAADPARGVLPAGEVAVEARGADALARALGERGWGPGELWTPLRLPLAEAPPEPGIRVENASAEQISATPRDPAGNAPTPAVRTSASPRDPISRWDLTAWAVTHWSAFREAEPTMQELALLTDRLRTMLEGPFGPRVRMLTGFDGPADPPAATATGHTPDRDAGSTQPVAIGAVWSAGPGRPGLLEPIGVHADHRRHGYGIAISHAAASALHELGASSAFVCTPTDLPGAATTYEKTGFTPQEPVPDLTRT